MTITGKLHVKNDAVTVSEKFRKREFVIEVIENPLYPQYLLFQLTQDKCELLEKYQVGQEIEVAFNLRGRSWVSPSGDARWFNTLEAWRIEGKGVPAVRNG